MQYKTDNETFKRIIVTGSKSDTNVWSLNSERIKSIASEFEGDLIKNYPQDGVSVIKVQKDNFEKIIQKLNDEGFKAREEVRLTPFLNESIPAIEGPFIWTNNGVQHELDGSGRIITILDSGIDDQHPDFQFPDGSSKILASKDFTGGGDPLFDWEGHGTHCAGIAAGSGIASNGKFKGVAPGAYLKIGKVDFESDLADGIRWAVQNGTDVISISMGDNSLATPDICSGRETNLIYNAIMDAIRNNVVVVVAAGNGGGDTFGNISFPACIEDVIAVGATFKNNYEVFDDLPEPDPTEDWRTDLGRVTVDITTYCYYETQTFSEEWQADYRFPHAFGFDYKPPYHWIQCGEKYCENKISVKMRAEHKARYCGSYPVKWWEDIWGITNYSFNSNTALEIAVRPSYREWTCPDNTIGYEFSIPSFNGNYFLTNQHIGFLEVNSHENLKNAIVFFSSRGPAPQNFNLVKPEVVAPGVNICAPRASDTQMGDLTCGNSNYVSASGTSMATPMVAGLVALLRQAYPDATVSQIRNSIASTNINKLGTIIGYNRPTNYTYGYGLISEKNAVKSICDSARPVYNCGSKDGLYCNGNNLEYRYYNFICPISSCDYKFWPSRDCTKSYESDYGLDYFSRGTCIEYDGCSNGACIEKSRKEDSCGLCVPKCNPVEPGCNLVNITICTKSSAEECPTHQDCIWNPNYVHEYYISGNSCMLSIKNCKDYGAACSYGRCFSGGGGGGGGRNRLV